MLRLTILLLLAVVTAPAMAQAPQRRAPTPTPAPQSGWGKPMVDFVAGYNATSTRLQFDQRARQINCDRADGSVLTRTCLFQTSDGISLVTAAQPDRQTLRDVMVTAEGTPRGVAALFSAFLVLLTHFEPTTNTDARGAAFNALFSNPPAVGGKNETTVGRTRIAVTNLPGGVGFLLGLAPMP
ncbi:hypothetical protein ACQW02_19840 [Humitalea sp. 24SJ18S-53]|uniref:hypothetical protein n=1 Tax=Humitalea sp. 24SJ18S-53 TaxID=3422307 RepID=UPI003D67D182